MRGGAIGGSGRQQPLTGVPVCVTWCQKGPCEYLQEGCWGWGAEASGRKGDTDTSQGALSWALCPGQHRDQGRHVAALQMATVPAATCRGQVGERERPPSLLRLTLTAVALQGAWWCLLFTAEEPEASRAACLRSRSFRGAELGLDPASLPPSPCCPSPALPGS